MNSKVSSMVSRVSVFVIALLCGCLQGLGPQVPTSQSDSYSLTLEFTRINSGTYNPFAVLATAKKSGVATAGLNLQVTLTKGSMTAVTDMGDGTYWFQVTPTATGSYPVTVAVGNASVTRKAVVLGSCGSGVGQPLEVPGDYVNTEGYEDGATVTPDGRYLFVQYGPVYFSGIFNITSLCSSASYSIGYDLNTCDGRTNSALVFATVGPKNDLLRPGFSTGAFSAGKIRHLPGFVIPGSANGLADFPTVFYGFKRQADGTFSQPFKLAFADDKRVNAPFGLSFKVNGDGTGTFLMAWNDYTNELGDDGVDVYYGSINFGSDNSLGTVTYGAAFGGDSLQAIAKNVSPVGFSSHTGAQGNPHLYSDSGGTVRSIWTDDEHSTQDITVYSLTSGTFPNGSWLKKNLPSRINTAGSESQPFFTGTELILARDGAIVYHTYSPTNGVCGNDFVSNDCWGPEVAVVSGGGSTVAGEIFSLGEPTVAEYEGKRYLYFDIVKSREVQAFPGVVDFNLDVGFVEIP